MSIITSRATSATSTGTGVISVSTSSATVTGVGTLFLTETLVGKALFTSADVYIGTISSINSNTSITLSANSALAAPGAAYKIGYQAINVPLTNTQIDNNFINLNNDKVEVNDAVSANTANKVVRRDSSGNFSAGTITAALSGNASTSTTLQTARNINGQAFNGSADVVVPTIYDPDFSRVINPGGGRYTTLTSTVTGAIAITLPVDSTDSMLNITIKMYEYSTNRAFELHVGGYSYASGWANSPFAYIVGNPTVDRRFNIRLGRTSTSKMIIYIGELNSTWSYPQVWVTECLVGYNGKSVNYTTGWTIGFQSSAFESVTATIASSDVQVGWTAQALATANSYQVGSLGVGTAASGTTGEIRATNSITSWYSDERLKENIKPIENALDKIDQLAGVLYTQNKLAEYFVKK
jgi:hypothetical protein